MLEAKRPRLLVALEDIERLHLSRVRVCSTHDYVIEICVKVLRCMTVLTDIISEPSLRTYARVERLRRINYYEPIFVRHKDRNRVVTSASRQGRVDS